MSPFYLLRWFELASVAAMECWTNGVLSWQPHLFLRVDVQEQRNKRICLCGTGVLHSANGGKFKREGTSFPALLAAYYKSGEMGFDQKWLFPSIGTIACTAISVVVLSKLTSVSPGASFRTLRRCCSFTPYQKTRETGVSSPCCLRK